MSDAPVRNRARRIEDARSRLEHDADLWLATADAGLPWLIPLSFHWTGEAVLMATIRRSATYCNLSQGGGMRIALGHTRDVVMIDGEVELPQDLPQTDADQTAAAAGLDPRTDPTAAFLRVVPRRVQAWRNVAELDERTIMRDGQWLHDQR